MNRINQLFSNKSKNILSVFFTAGYPNVDDTTPIIEALAGAGADMIEIGIPFSDPMADGPVIQQSNDRALKNGMTLSRLFDQLKTVRQNTAIPLILMGYFNPVLQFGIEKFCSSCAETGIDGVILPDLPLEIFEKEYKPLFNSYNLHHIYLISPQTIPERIREIDQATNSFIYMVSSSSVTGSQSKISEDQEAYFNRIRAMQLKNPTLIGFGISNHESFCRACQFAHGAIVGSAFIKALTGENSIPDIITRFTNQITGKNL